jgi:branched-chain amino acid transport system ATP-binding protein
MTAVGSEPDRAAGPAVADTLQQGGLDLDIRKIVVEFGRMRAISEVSAVISGGERLGLIGPNGAGKSTLLNVISGFVTPAAGSVHVGPDDVTTLPVRQRVRRGIVRSFQTARLLEGETVLTNVLLGRERYRHFTLGEQILSLPRYRRAWRRDRTAADDIMQMLKLSADAHRSVSELPFATRRLVEVARVLVAEPTVMLLDEPGAGLDAGSRALLADILLETHARRPCTIVLVEHDVALARRICQKLIVMDHGVVVAHGECDQVLELPEVRKAYTVGDHAEG